MLASSSYSKPLFPWLWPIEPSVLHQNGGYYMTTGNTSGTGTGFDGLPGRLPADARCCFKNLAFVDQAVAQTRTHRLQGVDLDLLITARDTAHHCLLTLPRWNELSELERQEINYFVYECCRLTCILYAHCVISPLLPGCPGIFQPLAELRALLELNQTRFNEKNISAMILWSLFIGGLAAFRTQHREFFIQRIRGLVFSQCIASLQHALNLSRAFIWADCACLQGVLVLWDLMGFPPGVVAQ